jgi:hypothetical protein
MEAICIGMWNSQQYNRNVKRKAVKLAGVLRRLYDKKLDWTFKVGITHAESPILLVSYSGCLIRSLLCAALPA